MFKNAIFLMFLLIPFLAKAEVYNCEGTWTNKPCSGKVDAVLEEARPKENADADPTLSQKRSMLHELKMKALEAKRRAF